MILPPTPAALLISSVAPPAPTVRHSAAAFTGAIFVPPPHRAHFTRGPFVGSAGNARGLRNPRRPLHTLLCVDRALCHDIGSLNCVYRSLSVNQTRM